MTISQMMFHEFDQEIASTRKLPACVPADNYAWKPHETFMSPGRLTGHVAEMPGWAVVSVMSPSGRTNRNLLRT